MKSPYTRRNFLKTSALAAGAGLTAPSWMTKLRAAETPTMPISSSSSWQIPAGHFSATRASLGTYQVPDWFRDAKFGIWAHWGPQSAAEYGDWYARGLYEQGSRQNKYHVAKYGHPSKFGHKDICAMWQAEKFDPDHLISLYKKAGARYFCSMAAHHDNFDLWNSKYQPHYNAVAMGPKKDILGLWRDATRKAGLKFAVSEHLPISFQWFAVSHLSDKTGPLTGVPYDGADPRWAELYHDYSHQSPGFAESVGGKSVGRPEDAAWESNYFNRIIDLIDQHQPDLLYTDGGIPYGDLGLAIVAHHYNTSITRNGGINQGVYASKTHADADAGMCILDIERGVNDGISPAPWQTDTCIGNWHYDRTIYEGNKYKTAKDVILMLCDIVSRNGNLQLNFPLPANGMLDDTELKILDGITQWMAVNSEGIYATRPYKIFGDGPIATAPPPTGRFNEGTRAAIDARDVRYTTKGDTLYAFVMGWPDKAAVIPSLATTAKQGVGKIQNVELLGIGKVPFTQDDRGLIITLPEKAPSDYAVTFKINGA